jgi:hypothetical protein
MEYCPLKFKRKAPQKIKLASLSAGHYKNPALLSAEISNFRIKHGRS